MRVRHLMTMPADETKAMGLVNKAQEGTPLHPARPCASCAKNWGGVGLSSRRRVFRTFPHRWFSPFAASSARTLRRFACKSKVSHFYVHSVSINSYMYNIFLLHSIPSYLFQICMAVFTNVYTIYSSSILRRYVVVLTSCCKPGEPHLQFDWRRGSGRRFAKQIQQEKDSPEWRLVWYNIIYIWYQ